MKNKKNIFIIIIVVIAILAIFKYMGDSRSDLHVDRVTINKYSAGKSSVEKSYTIDDKSKLKELGKYVKKLKPLNDKEAVKLTLLKDIEIKYNDSITIEIQRGEKDYCYYINKDKNISSLSKMPKGLYQWTMDNIK